MKTIKIIWQGIGGEGIKTATAILATAINKTKYTAQSFPEYGPERSGAKTSAYTRISDREINSHYPIVNPNILVSTYDNSEFNCLKIIASDKLQKDDLIFNIPAKEIAKNFNSSYSNLPLIGALIAILEKYYSLDAKQILDSFKTSVKINPDIIREGYNKSKSIL